MCLLPYIFLIKCLSMSIGAKTSCAKDSITARWIICGSDGKHMTTHNRYKTQWQYTVSMSEQDYIYTTKYVSIHVSISTETAL